MLRLIASVLIFPLFLFGDTNAEFSEIFAEKLSSQDILGCHKVLDEWENYESHIFFTTQGLRATLVLLQGNISQSILMMEIALSKLEKNYLSHNTVTVIRDLYKQALDFGPLFETPSLTILCEDTQTKGLKMKYWFGIAQIIAACIVAPFSPATAGALALSGINTTVQAAGDALDKKEEWERNLNERKQMAPPT